MRADFQCVSYNLTRRALLFDPWKVMRAEFQSVAYNLMGNGAIGTTLDSHECCPII